jgi:ABC-type phosphate/phosphonate transport system substrate-binding protein
VKKGTRRAVAVSILMLAMAGTALGGPRDLLLCLPGFPGTTAQAQPYVDKVMRYLEGKLGWEAGSMKGVYLPDGSEGAARLASDKPGLALIGPSVYASLHKKHGMKVVARVEVNGRGEDTYSVVTATNGPSTLAELAGKTIVGAVLSDPRYVANVLLDAKLEEGNLKLAQENKPLSALRSVARGKADAAIVDQSVIDHMKELDFASSLRVIYTSPAVSAPAVVVMGTDAKQAKAVADVLLGMCDRPDGKELCQTLTISSIKPATDADYAGLLKRYAR